MNYLNKCEDLFYMLNKSFILDDTF